MSSEKLGHNNNVLKGDLGGGFNILTGSTGEQTDLGIARRFGGSAAAYSLRDIGAMNRRVVKVRRDGDDSEEDFSASQVQSGALEDWVNGKFENTLPADVATAEAAYSLRKVKDGYSGNAVRVRRSSDNIEVNVGFDSEGKVSASSSISNVVENSSSSNTSSTTLGEFINGTDAFVHTWYDQTEDTTVTSNKYTSSFASGDFDTFSDNALDNTARQNPVQGLGGFDGFALHLKVSASSAFQVSALTGRAFAAGDGLRFKLGLYMPSTNTDLRKIKVYTDGSNGNSRTMGGEYLRPALDQWVDYEFTDIAESNVIGFRFVQDDGTLGNCAVGDQVYVRLIVIDAITKAGNNATQGTSANQPKIASSGSLLANGLLFDGTNSFMQTMAGFALAASDDLSFSVVMQSSNLSATQNVISQENGTGTGRSWLILSNDDFQTFLGGSAALFGTFTTSKFLFTSIYDDSAATIDAFNNSATSGSQLTSKTVEAASGELNIGESKTGTNRLDGSIEEIILYKSDQTAKRFNIESNINNYYGLYTFQGDGFVATWYDQSSNGNDATQATASKQPKIVSNGGTNKLEGLPTINFDDATSHCLTSSSYSRSGSDLPLSMMAVFDKSTTDTDYLFAANKSNDDAFQRLVLRSTSFEYGERDDSNTQKIGTGGSPSLNTIFLMSAFTGGTTSSAFVNGSSIISDQDTDLGTQTFDQIDIGANNGDGASSANPFSGNISELYLFETNLSTDRTTIESEIANHYNITLS